MSWRSYKFLFVVPILFFTLFFGNHVKPSAQAPALIGGAINAGGSLGTAVAAQVTPPPKTLAKDDPERCRITNLSIVACVDVFFAFLIKVYFIQIAGWFLWISANLLDYIINVGILNFADWAPKELYPIWVMVRQTVTLFVVFSGLYLGFMYIINQKDTFKKYIAWVVIYGLFVNFSYPLVRASIDLSNIISLNIYKSSLGTQTAGTAGTLIMKSLGLGKIVDAATQNDVDVEKKSGDMPTFYDQLNTTPAALLVVGYILYATYIFFIAGGILLMRTIALSFIIVVSPLLFVDAVVPKLGEAAQKLRKILFEQLAVSIVFMVMFYLTISMTKVFQSTPGALASSAVAQVFNILMMLVTLHIMMKVTKAVSGSVGQMAADFTGRVGGFATGAALGVATGGAGLLARSTVGAAAARWSESDTLKNAQGSWVGRRGMDLANSLKNSTFDARNTKVMGVAGNMGGFSKGLTVAPSLKSYEKAKQARQEEVSERANLIQDDDKRAKYLEQEKWGLGSMMQRSALGAVGLKGRSAMSDSDLAVEAAEVEAREKKRKEAAELVRYANMSEEEKGDARYKSRDNKKMTDSMSALDSYNKAEPEDIKTRVDNLVKLNDPKAARDVIKNTRFKDLEEAQAKEIEGLENILGTMKNTTDEEKLAYDTYKTKIGEKKKTNRDKIEGIKKEMLDAFNSRVNPQEGLTLENDEQVKSRLDSEQNNQEAAPKIDWGERSIDWSSGEEDAPKTNADGSIDWQATDAASLIIKKSGPVKPTRTQPGASAKPTPTPETATPEQKVPEMA